MSLSGQRSTIDEKGNTSLSMFGVGDGRLALSFNLLRGLQQIRLRQLMTLVYNQSDEVQPSAGVQCIVDLFVLCFQTRDINDGKGERDVFYDFFINLWWKYPKTGLSMLHLIPNTYGSWKDMLRLWEKVHKMTKREMRKKKENRNIVILEKMILFQTSIEKLMMEQLLKDEEVLAEREVLQLQLKDGIDDFEKELVNEQLKLLKLSLLGKWMPRENQHFGLLGRRLAEQLYGLTVGAPVPTFRSEDNTTDTKEMRVKKHKAYQSYRQRITALNKALGTPEVFMCCTKGEWYKLNPAVLPARMFKMSRRAILNIPTQEQRQEGRTRRSENPDRIRCAEKFTSFLDKAVNHRQEPGSKEKVHGATLQPHEIIDAYMKNNVTMTTGVDMTLEAQWINLRETLMESGSLGKMIPLVDVSGSMSGTPMLVAIAMGILVSELTHEVFKDKFITFETQPKWIDLSLCNNTLMDKIKTTKSAPWGGSTDMIAALNLLLTRAKEAKMSNEEMGELTLVIFSDMQFNSAQSGGEWTTKYMKLKDEFLKTGYSNVPRILFWNLRSNPHDYPAGAETPGVQMVSGFSASMLKRFMEEGNVPDSRETAYEGLRKELDSPRYDPVRQLCGASEEIVKSGIRYIFVPASDEHNNENGSDDDNDGTGGSGGEKSGNGSPDSLDTSTPEPDDEAEPENENENENEPESESRKENDDMENTGAKDYLTQSGLNINAPDFVPMSSHCYNHNSPYIYSHDVNQQDQSYLYSNPYGYSTSYSSSNTYPYLSETHPYTFISPQDQHTTYMMNHPGLQTGAYKQYSPSYTSYYYPSGDAHGHIYEQNMNLGG